MAAVLVAAAFAVAHAFRRRYRDDAATLWRCPLAPFLHPFAVAAADVQFRAQRSENPADEVPVLFVVAVTIDEAFRRCYWNYTCTTRRIPHTGVLQAVTFAVAISELHAQQRRTATVTAFAFAATVVVENAFW